MGHMHYFRIPKTIPKPQFRALVKEAVTLYGALPPDLAIRGGDGTGEPELNEVCICLNGDAQAEVDGDSLWIPRVMSSGPHQHPDRKNRFGHHCRTEHRPYDFLVAVLMISLKRHVKDAVISSDANYKEWEPMLAFYAQVTGFSMAFDLLMEQEPIPSRSYRPEIDYQRFPLKAIVYKREMGLGFRYDLVNGLFLDQDCRGGGWGGRFGVFEPGAHASGCAASRGRCTTLRLAILRALEIKPYETCAQKRERIEARAQAEVDPSLLGVVDSLLDDCRSMFGPIGEEARDRIKTYMLNPTVETWGEMFSLLLGGGMGGTVWCWWLKINQAAPKSGPTGDFDNVWNGEWDLIPTPMEILIILGEVSKAEQAKSEAAKQTKKGQ